MAKIKFNVCGFNKKEDDELIILNNELDTDSLRIRYNPNTKYISDRYKCIFNAFKREVNLKFNLILDDNTKIEGINQKHIMKDDFREGKLVGFETLSCNYSFSVATPDVFDKYFHDSIINGKNPMWAIELVE